MATISRTLRPVPTELLNYFLITQQKFTIRSLQDAAFSHFLRQNDAQITALFKAVQASLDKFKVPDEKREKLAAKIFNGDPLYVIFKRPAGGIVTNEILGDETSFSGRRPASMEEVAASIRDWSLYSIAATQNHILIHAGERPRGMLAHDDGIKAEFHLTPPEEMYAGLDKFIAFDCKTEELK